MPNKQLELAMEDTNTPKSDLSKKEWEAIMTDYKESGLSQQ